MSEPSDQAKSLSFLAEIEEMLDSGKSPEEILNTIHDQEFNRLTRERRKQRSDEAHEELRAWVQAPDLGEEDDD